MSKAKARWGDKYQGVVVGIESFGAQVAGNLAAAIGIADVARVEALQRDLNHQINIWRAMKASENKPRGRQVELAISEIADLAQRLRRRLEAMDFESRAAIAHVLATTTHTQPWKQGVSSGWLALDSIELEINYLQAVAEQALSLRRFSKAKRGPSPLRNTLASILIDVYERHSGRQLVSCFFSPIDGEYRANPPEALCFIEDCFDQLGEANLQGKPSSVGALIQRALRNRSHSEAS